MIFHSPFLDRSGLFSDFNDLVSGVHEVVKKFQVLSIVTFLKAQFYPNSRATYIRFTIAFLSIEATRKFNEEN